MLVVSSESSITCRILEDKLSIKRLTILDSNASTQLFEQCFKLSEIVSRTISYYSKLLGVKIAHQIWQMEKIA